MPKTKKYTLYIDGNDIVEYIFVVLSGRSNEPFNAGIIKKTVYSAVFLQSNFDIALHIARSSHISTKIKPSFIILCN